MADPFFSLDGKSLTRILARLKIMGVNMVPAMAKVMDYAGATIVSHARGQHFFVGVGAGAGAEAQANVFTFKNPDGTPRFKIRTANLLQSIQDQPTEIKGKEIFKAIRAGMEYARDVEEGGPGRRSFPFMRPAFEASKPKILKEAVKFFKQVLKESGGKG